MNTKHGVCMREAIYMYVCMNIDVTTHVSITIQKIITLCVCMCMYVCGSLVKQFGPVVCVKLCHN